MVSGSRQLVGGMETARQKSKIIEHMVLLAVYVDDGSGHLGVMCVCCVPAIDPHTVFLYVFLIQGMEIRASCMLHKGFTAEPHPQEPYWRWGGGF